MTLSIPLNASTEAALRRQAAEVGQEVSEYVRALLEEAVTKRSGGSVATSEGNCSLYDRLEPVLKSIWAEQGQTPSVPLRGDEAIYQEALVEKYRKQGLKL